MQKEFKVTEKYSIRYDIDHELNDDNQKIVYRKDSENSNTYMASFHFDKPYEAAVNYIYFMEGLLDKLPDNLTLQRNSAAPEHDRWRLLNPYSKRTIENTGANTAEKCMQKYLTIEEDERKKWVGEN